VRCEEYILSNAAINNGMDRWCSRGGSLANENSRTMDDLWGKVLLISCSNGLVMAKNRGKTSV
jgi:hypothetical protein